MRKINSRDITKCRIKVNDMYKRICHDSFAFPIRIFYKQSHSDPTFTNYPVRFVEQNTLPSRDPAPPTSNSLSNPCFAQRMLQPGRHPGQNIRRFTEVIVHPEHSHVIPFVPTHKTITRKWDKKSKNGRWSNYLQLFR